MTAQSLQQRRAALARANEVKLRRVKAKRAIFEGKLSITDALDLDCCQTMSIYQLLGSQYLWGPVTTLEACSRIPISPYRRVQDLTPRQRRALIEAVGE